MSRLEYYLNMAKAVSLRGDCTRRQVGAVIVWDDRIWATGYNGTPGRDEPSCPEGACPRGQKSYEEHPGYQEGNQDFSDCIAVHAEENAIRQFAMFYRLFTDYPDSTELPIGWAHWVSYGVPVVYVSEVPCEGCAKLLVKAGFTEVFWPGGSWSEGEHKTP